MENGKLTYNKRVILKIEIFLNQSINQIVVSHIQLQEWISMKQQSRK